jgi:A/G-specific adenine glycosylase
MAAAVTAADPVSRTSIEQERNEALLAWYRSEERDLPWRATRDPYAILVSEIMLQQTQASRVVPFYERFVRRYPTVESLARAPLSDVLTLWSGLGYNTRAQRLQQAAAHVAQHGWPRSVEGLEQLPGVGPYTARAVASIAFGVRVAAIDTNLRRVLSRWHGEALSGTALEAAAELDLGEDAACWNQAMMDLGATRCRPRRPACGECPVREWCAGPGVYEPPRSQGRFEGSMRQVRGAIVRTLIRGPVGFAALVDGTAIEPDLVAVALESLIVEGLVVERSDASYTLPD